MRSSSPTVSAAARRSKSYPANGRCTSPSSCGRPSDMSSLGRTRWVIAEGYIPGTSSMDTRALESHETACILNAGERDANVTITLFFAERDPVRPYRVRVRSKRARHVRFSALTQPEPVPRDTDYSSGIESDVPIVVQHTRLDSRHAALALLSTMAFPAE